MAQRRFTIRRVGTLALIGSGLCFLLANTPAGAQPACVGDCDGGGTVAINELILGVNISLGSQPVSACEAFDCESSGSVGITCLIQGVNNSLQGCGGTPGPTATATPVGTPSTCPLAPGRYIITQGAGGVLRVATFTEFPFPAGGTVVIDVAAGQGAECIHSVVVPGDGGFESPTFCIPALGFSVNVEQNACGVGQIDSNGGSDYTVAEIGDTSDTNGPCDLPQDTCVSTLGEDSSLRVNITVGDGTPDTCTGGTGNAIIAIPVHTTTWLEFVSTPPGQCPAIDGEFNPENGDQLVVEFDQVLDFTTDATTTVWDDLDDDGCAIAGIGPPAGFPSRSGTCMDLDAQTVTNVASGPVGSSGSPTFDLTFVTFLPNTYEGPDTAATPATCDTPPVINFTGVADRCLESP
jgi:hypothetical protein